MPSVPPPDSSTPIGQRAAIRGERSKEDVDRVPLPHIQVGDPQPVLPHGQRRRGREHIGVVRLQRLAVDRAEDRDGGVPAEDLVEQRDMTGTEMGYNNIGNAGIGRHGREETAQCFDTARRRAEARDRKCGARAGLTRRRTFLT